MEEFEILDLEELSKEKGFKKAAQYLKTKLSKGFKVSVMIKKLYHISLPPLQQKKNEFFSKNHQPIEINTESSQPNDNGERLGSSTSSHSSVPKQPIPPTQNETPQQQMEDIKSESSQEQVSLYHLKDDSFEQQLKGSQQHQKIQNALLFYRDGNLREALSRFIDCFNECWDSLKANENKAQIKMFILLCIQAVCYSGQIYRQIGNSTEAIKLFDKCLNQFEINDFDLVGKIHLEKALCFVQNNQLLMALDQYNKALLQYEQVNWKLDIARVLIKMSYVYSLLNNFEDAKKMCYEGLKIYQLKLGQQDPRIFETYYTLGVIYYYQKDYDIAIEYLSQALDGYKRVYGEKHISLVKILNLLGVIHHLQSNLNQAIDFYEGVVYIYGDETHIGLACVLNNLALAYLDKMKFKSARLSFDKALSILKQYYLNTHPHVRRIENNSKLLAYATLSYL